jgi:hypothetical protein
VRPFFIAIDKSRSEREGLHLIHLHCLILESTSSSRNRFLQLPCGQGTAARPRLRPDMADRRRTGRTVSDPSKTTATANTAQPLDTGAFGGQTAPRSTACRLCNQLEEKAGDWEANPFSLCSLQTLRGHEAEDLRLWPRETNLGAHTKPSVHLQFHEVPPPPHQLPACDKRQSYHSFIPRASIFNSPGSQPRAY